MVVSVYSGLTVSNECFNIQMAEDARSDSTAGPSAATLAGRSRGGDTAGRQTATRVDRLSTAAIRD